MITEISYRCYCACGGAANPRLFSRALYDKHGNYLRTVYYDSGNGPLTAWPTHKPPTVRGETP